MTVAVLAVVVPTAASPAPAPLASYETWVNPGDGIQFLYPRTLFALSGQPLNTLDAGLTAPAALTITWPSSSLLVSRDAGRTWRRSLSAPAGFWGLAFDGSPLAFAVGVNVLYRSWDGGTRWRRIGEPGQPLVRVALLGGYKAAGLTANGRMVMTNDGGSSWQPASWGGHGRAVCAVGGGVLVADERGGVWESKRPGHPFKEDVGGLSPPAEDGPWWVDLSCGVRNAVEFMQSVPEAAGAAAETVVRQSTNRGLTWRRVAEITNGAANENAPAPTEAVAVGSRTACILSYPRAPTADVDCTGDGGRAFRHARTPLISSLRSGAVHLQGVTFVGPSDGWLEVVGSAAAGPRFALYQTEVWATRDAAASWRVAYASPIGRVAVPR